MNILGAIIRTDEIIGISNIHWIVDGNTGCYRFEVVCKSCAVNFQSDLIQDYQHATKQEQQHLAEFRSKYQIIRNEIGLMIGEQADVVDHFFRIRKSELLYQGICDHADHLSCLIKSTKLKSKEAMLETLGQIWVNAKEIHELNQQ
jgi:hypothetical protein